MANKKISELTELTTANEDLEFIVNDSGVSKRVKKSTIVDNDFTNTLKSKLDGIEAGATADQTNAQIKTAYEANADTNEFSDAEQTKLSGIETSADVTDTTNVVASLTAGTNVAISADGTISSTDTDTTYSVGDGGLTTNDFTNADHTKLNAIEDSATSDQTGAEIKTAYQAESNAFTDAQFTKLAGIEASATSDQTNAEIRTAVESATDSNVFTDADNTKLDGIEASADVTDSTNVVAALTAGTNVAISAGGTISSTDTDTTYTAGTNVTLTGTVFSSTDTVYTHPSTAGNKHIPTGGSSGQFLKYSSSGTAVWASDNNTTYAVGDGGLTTNDFTNADHSKLNSIEASADVTDSTNVVAALTAGTNVSISAGGTISSTDTDTTYSEFSGTASGLVPTSTTTDDTKFLRADGTWVIPTDSDTTYSVGDGGLSQINFTTADNTKLDGIATSANNYTHPTGDGNLHVPATLTTNNAKVLTAGSTAGSLSWETPSSGGAAAIDDLTDGTTGGGTGNIGLGSTSLDSVTTGSSNVAVGNDTMTAITDGTSNVAIGRYAMSASTSGEQNVAVGYNSLKVLSSYFSYNTAVGYQTMMANTSGIDNVAFGHSALSKNTTGKELSAFGKSSLLENTTGTGNLGFGYRSLELNTTGNHNVGIGWSAGKNITTGSNNTIIGELSGTAALADTVLIGAGATERLKVNATGLYVNGTLQSGGGASSIDDLTDAVGYTFVDGSVTYESYGLGEGALSSVANGYSLVAVGDQSLASVTSGHSCTAVGANSLESMTTGTSNSAFGAQALKAVTTGTRNCAFGYLSSLRITTGSANHSVGQECLKNNTVGSNNCGFGRESLEASTGDENTAYGNFSLKATTGTKNIGIGYTAGDAITTGSNNTVIGDLPGSTTLADTVLIGAGTTERLKVNATGLYVNGTLQSSGGGWSLISTSDIASAITSFTLSGDYSAYSQLKIVMTNMVISGATTRLKMSDDSGSTFCSWDQSSSINYNNYGLDGSSVVYDQAYTYVLPSVFGKSSAIGGDPYMKSMLEMDIYLDGNDIFYSGRGDGNDSGGDHCFCMFSGRGGDIASVNYINFSFLSWSGGQVRLYGLTT